MTCARTCKPGRKTSSISSLAHWRKRINVDIEGMERRFTEILAMRIVESEARLNRRLGLLEEPHGADGEIPG